MAAGSAGASELGNELYCPLGIRAVSGANPENVQLLPFNLFHPCADRFGKIGRAGCRQGGVCQIAGIF